MGGIANTNFEIFEIIFSVITFVVEPPSIPWFNIDNKEHLCNTRVVRYRDGI